MIKITQVIAIMLYSWCLLSAVLLVSSSVLVEQDWTKVYSGLRNSGTSCFMLSMLQLLFHNNGFSKEIMSLENNDFNGNAIGPTGKALQNLFYAMHTSGPKKSNIDTGKLAMALGYGARPAMGDTSQFLQGVTAELTKEISSAGHKNKLDSLLTISTVIKKNCVIKNTSDEIPDCKSPIPYSSPYFTVFTGSANNLVTALDSVFTVPSEEPLADPHYDKLKLYQKITVLPNTVTFFLSRTNMAEVGKVADPSLLSHEFSFPMELNVEKYLESPVNGQNYDYVLSGIVANRGKTEKTGHAYSFIINPATKQWYKFDDTSVTAVSKDVAVNENYGKNSGTSSFVCAYALVYVLKSKQDEYSAPLDETQFSQRVLGDNENVKVAQPPAPKPAASSKPIAVPSVVLPIVNVSPVVITPIASVSSSTPVSTSVASVSTSTTVSTSVASVSASTTVPKSVASVPTSTAVPTPVQAVVTSTIVSTPAQAVSTPAKVPMSASSSPASANIPVPASSAQYPVQSSQGQSCGMSSGSSSGSNIPYSQSLGVAVANSASALPRAAKTSGGSQTATPNIVLLMTTTLMLVMLVDIVRR